MILSSSLLSVPIFQSWLQLHHVPVTLHYSHSQPAIPAPSLEMEVGLLALPWSSEIPVLLSSFPHIFLNGLSWLKFSVYGIKDKWGVCHALVFPSVQGMVCSLKMCKQILSMLYKNYNNTFCQGKHHSIANKFWWLRPESSKHLNSHIQQLTWYNSCKPFESVDPDSCYTVNPPTSLKALFAPLSSCFS